MRQRRSGNGLLLFLLVGTLLIFDDLLAQTCQSDITSYAPVERFKDNGNGIIMDKLTGLMWKGCSEGQTWQHGRCQGDAAINNWQKTLLHAEAANREGGYAGYSDWRVPNIKELESLVELACFESAINMEIFPDTPAWYYWSASPYLGDSEFAWGIGFRYGKSLIGRKSQAYHLRLVREGY